MIAREPIGATERSYDLAIVGGGIYGVSLACEAARRGLAVLLLERDDFGGATSWNSLRIIHGGLRYLQTMDFIRFFESVAERRWFCRTFPELVRPLPCLMPLYCRGMKRPLVMRLALWANDILSRRRNADVPDSCRLPGGRVFDADETVRRFPAASRKGLRGGALWYDAAMRSPQRVLIEMLHWACHCGATALNYTEVTAIRSRRNQVAGITARDRLDDVALQFDARYIVNCAGPWSRQIASAFDHDVPKLFRPSLAFNVLLDRPAPADLAVAVEPPRKDASVLFLYPAYGGTLAGTVHVPWIGSREDAQPTDAQIAHLLDDLNIAIPGFDARPEHVRCIMSGLLPASANGTAALARRPVIHAHGRHNGLRNLFSVSGVKFTTSRLVAEQTLRAIFADDIPAYVSDERPQLASEWAAAPPHVALGAEIALQRLVNEEAVMNLDDLLYRRTDWILHRDDAGKLRSRVRSLLGWHDDGRFPEAQSPQSAAAQIA